MHIMCPVKVSAASRCLYVEDSNYVLRAVTGRYADGALGFPKWRSGSASTHGPCCQVCEASMAAAGTPANRRPAFFALAQFLHRMIVFRIIRAVSLYPFSIRDTHNSH
jgi:hypothetical protein